MIEGIDWTADGLAYRVSFDLLDLNRQKIDELAGVTSLSVGRSMFTTPQSSASLGLRVSQLINWFQVLVRPMVRVSLAGYVPEDYALITGMVDLSAGNRSESGLWLKPKLNDLTRLLDDPLGQHLSVAPGDLVTARVRTWLEGLGIYDAAITESSAVVSAGAYWDPTKTWRRAINDLLGSIAYRAVWANEWGQFQCHPYVPALKRARVEPGLVAGVNCTYLPEFDIEQDVNSVPNHLVAVQRTDGEATPVLGEAWNNDPDSKYSTTNRRTVTVVEPDVEMNLGVVDPQGDANKIAQKLLFARSSPGRSYGVEYRWAPYDLQDRLRFFSPGDPGRQLDEIDVDTVLSDQQVKWEAGTDSEALHATSTLQEVFE